jgi:hypothetical protein
VKDWGDVARATRRPKVRWASHTGGRVSTRATAGTATACRARASHGPSTSTSGSAVRASQAPGVANAPRMRSPIVRVFPRASSPR